MENVLISPVGPEYRVQFRETKLFCLTYGFSRILHIPLYSETLVSIMKSFVKPFCDLSSLWSSVQVIFDLKLSFDLINYSVNICYFLVWISSLIL